MTSVQATVKENGSPVEVTPDQASQLLTGLQGMHALPLYIALAEDQMTLTDAAGAAVTLSEGGEQVCVRDER